MELYKHFLGVGVNNYLRSYQSPLQGCVADVALVNKTLGLKEGTILVDDSATISNVVEALNRIPKDESAHLWFSCHGFEGGFALYDGILNDGYIENWLFNRLQTTETIFNIDSCHGGGINIPASLRGMLKTLYNRGMNNQIKLSIMSACQPQQVSLSVASFDGQTWQGAYTKSFCYCYNNIEGEMTTSSFMDIIQMNMKNSRYEQIPTLYGNPNLYIK